MCGWYRHTHPRTTKQCKPEIRVRTRNTYCSQRRAMVESTTRTRTGWEGEVLKESNYQTATRSNAQHMNIFQWSVYMCESTGPKQSWLCIKRRLEGKKKNTYDWSDNQIIILSLDLVCVKYMSLLFCDWFNGDFYDSECSDKMYMHTNRLQAF